MNIYIRKFVFFLLHSFNFYQKLIVERIVQIQRTLTSYYKLISKCNV
jgi:hypothetical protein